MGQVEVNCYRKSCEKGEELGTQESLFHNNSEVQLDACYQLLGWGSVLPPGEDFLWFMMLSSGVLVLPLNSVAIASIVLPSPCLCLLREEICRSNGLVFIFFASFHYMSSLSVQLSTIIVNTIVFEI